MTLETSVTGPSEGVFTHWVGELRFTWLAVALFSVVPGALFGSAIVSISVFAVSVLFGLPFALFGSATNGSRSRGVRRLVVILGVTTLTLAYVAEVDERVPKSAAPLTQAIESFRHETGHDPDSLEVLVPKYLPELPDVRPSVVQPLISYRISNGRPHLAIPSVMDDMFAQSEYDFETRNWLHQS